MLGEKYIYFWQGPYCTTTTEKQEGIQDPIPCSDPPTHKSCIRLCFLLGMENSVENVKVAKISLYFTDISSNTNT